MRPSPATCKGHTSCTDEARTRRARRRQGGAMDQRHHDDRTDERASHSLVPDEAPDSVETRDPRSHPTPRQSRSWLFAIPAVALLILGAIWMFWAERARQGAQSAPYAVAGTSGATDNDPEGSGR